jgi:hypothetical protein
MIDNDEVMAELGIYIDYPDDAMNVKAITIGQIHKNVAKTTYNMWIILIETFLRYNIR